VEAKAAMTVKATAIAAEVDFRRFFGVHIMVLPIQNWGLFPN